ncbi:hypothetical protein D3C79_757420 [compost metagenome]
MALVSVPGRTHISNLGLILTFILFASGAFGCFAIASFSSCLRTRSINSRLYLLSIQLAEIRFTVCRLSLLNFPFLRSSRLDISQLRGLLSINATVEAGGNFP